MDKNENDGIIKRDEVTEEMTYEDRQVIEHEC